MSSSEVATHQFTDDEISNVEVNEWYDLDRETPVEGIYFDVTNPDTGSVSCAFLSKEDLLHLLKLIEETN